MLQAATVSIVHDDARSAGKEAATELIYQLDGPPDLVLLFVAPRYEPARLLEGLFSKLPKTTRLGGCSTFGEINSEEALGDSVTVMGIRSRDVAFRTFKVEKVGADSMAAGRALGAEVKDFAPDLLILLPDALKANATRLLRGLKDTAGEALPIIGGMAADNRTYTTTYQYHDAEAISDGAVAIGIKGPIKLVTGARSGWIAVGGTRRITKVENGNVIVELDGRPALDLYEEYLGARAQEMPAISAEFPIGLVDALDEKEEEKPGDHIRVCRGIRSVDRERRAILVGADVPEGGGVRMTRATKEDLIEAANQVGDACSAAMPDASLALFFNCAARKMVLGRRYKSDLVATFDRLGDKVPKIGFYTYGEISPVQERSTYHELTFTMALLKG